MAVDVLNSEESGVSVQSAAGGDDDGAPEERAGARVFAVRRETGRRVENQRRRHRSTHALSSLHIVT